MEIFIDEFTTVGDAMHTICIVVGAITAADEKFLEFLTNLYFQSEFGIEIMLISLGLRFLGTKKSGIGA